MNNRRLGIALAIVGVAAAIVSILALSTLVPTVALPLTNEGMIMKANALPEVKAFVDKYPNYSIGAGNSTSDNAEGYVDFRIGDGAYHDKTSHGYQKFDNILQLTVLFNKESAEIVEISLDCAANKYHSEFGRSIGEVDTDKTFHFTTADRNILGYIQQGQDELCFKTPR